MPNLNTNTNLAKAPADLEIKRSRLDRSFSHKTSFNVGELIPIYCEEVLPGDTFDVQTNAVVRLQSLLTPIMDNLYLDISYWFVPMRLTWEHTKEFFGENTASAWIPQVSYTMPQVTSPASTGWTVGTLADHFGIPTGIAGLSVSALPFRAYSLICNEWWRSENLTDPLSIPLNDSTQTGSNGTNYITDVVNGGAPFKAAKFFDLFTAALPAPQKGPDVMLNMADGYAPVVTRANYIPSSVFSQGTGNAYQFRFMTPGYNYPQNFAESYVVGLRPADVYASDQTAIYGSFSAQPNLTRATGNDLIPANLWADNTVLPGISVNQFRMAFQIQKFYERQARSGSRYTEVIKSFFGVTSPDYRLQRPEYLGGKRQAINVNAVTQTSASESGLTPQGNQAAYSVTHLSHNDFFKSFTEHGYVIGLAVVRYDHSYQQGLSKMWSRKSKFDFYWPVFANLGEQAILNKEIYAQGSSVVDSDGNIVDDQVFGYQEAWYDYRYPKNLVTGEMRSTYSTSLDVWHLGDDYNSLPQLSDGWIREDKANVDRVLAVTSAVSNQLFADFYFKNYVTRPMPVFSIPGLVDHH